MTITATEGGITITGDSINTYRVLLLRSGLGLYIKSEGRIIPTRGMGLKAMLKLATAITGKAYKTSMAQAVLALADLGGPIPPKAT